jgi:5-hydroxyisourate hydrolase-like protein (transthyretin family)
MTLRSARQLFLLACCLHASPPPSTRGRVLDAVTGRGIPGVRVSAASGGSHLTVWLHTLTDANGDFEFAQITGGWMTCEREGYKQLLESEIVGADGIRPESYQAGGVTITTPLFFLMVPVGYQQWLANSDAFVSGRVVDETDRPMAGVEVEARRVRSDSRDHLLVAETDGEGRFTLKLPPGEAELTAADRPCKTSGQKRVSLPSRIELAAGENREVRLVIKPVRSYQVAGLIENRVPPYDGIIQLSLFPLTGVHRNIGCDTGALKESARSFSFGAVPAGKYIIEATLAKNVHDCDTCSGEPVYTVDQPIELPVKNGGPLKIDFYPGMEITGVIHWEDKPPAFLNSGSFCIVNPTGTRYCSDGKDSQTFHLSRVQPGEYRVVAGMHPGELFVSRPADFYLNEARLNDQPLSSMKFVIEPDMSRAALDLYVANSAAYCVAHVVDSDRHPLSLYTVALMQKQDGRYVVKDFDPRVAERYPFKPGKYLLLALTPPLPRLAFRREILEQYADRAVPVTLTAGETLKVEVVAIEDHPLARLQ